ncbi:hypothetical protein QUH71_02290 [Priestia aryabhattai]|uniref:hypothetical protein n=1 Tax=Priestia aryabhattai TaxID=412384 RepID=UPI0025A427AB|nr:hypothetical protein [Priestia aryabhattai]WJN45333.1 hypothetical protein QUH71_02290 [Priestia aryabhattai]
MKFLKGLLEKVLTTIILNVLTPTLTLIASKISTGNWFSSFKSPFFIIISILLMTWLISALVYRRVTLIKAKNNDSLATFITTPLHGWRKIAEVDYCHVKWIVEEPIHKIGQQTDVNSIEVDSVARCPNCHAELEEKMNFFGRYLWICVVCNFKKSNKESMSKEAMRATRIAKNYLQQDKKRNYN